MTQKLLLSLLCLLFVGCRTTIYMVRHAEKAAPDATMSNDVPLSKAGLSRAADLKNLLAGKRLHGVFATQYQRTYQTVAPTAAANGLEVKRYPSKAGDALLDSLIALRGKRLLVAGHSNSVPAMLRHVGLQPSFAGDIPENDYDNLFIIRVKKPLFGARTTRLEQTTYGRPSP